MTHLAQQLVNGLLLGSLYALVALGLTMIYGVLRVLHVAHAATYVVGAYVGLAVFLWSGRYLAAVLAAGVLMGLLGALTERVVYRPTFRSAREVALVASIGLFTVLTETVRLVAGPEPRPFLVGLPGGFAVGDLWVSAFDVTFVAVSGGALLALAVFLTRTRLGLALRAVAQSRDVAAMLGVDVDRCVQAVFFVGSFLAGVAGALVGPFYSYIDPNMGNTFAYKALAVIVIGGFGSVTGTLAGGLALGVAEVLLVVYTRIPLSQEALAMLALVVLLLVRPRGLPAWGAVPP
ncbi:MAG TPA: branched-chain amino acid ABC transporter permease [Methylomirabilota bacterium]|nr:branched-chain amino acid ABC transporter permease [Methylomirabilota bacterium]